MKPNLTAEQVDRLTRMIDDLDALYTELMPTNIESYQIAKISVARADLAFVLASCNHLPPKPVTLHVLESVR